jgi:hypothetical protein
MAQKADVHLYQHPSSAGDESYAFIYLLALIEDIPQAADDMGNLVELFTSGASHDIFSRAKGVVAYIRSPKRLLAQARLACRKDKDELQSQPFGVFDIVTSLFPDAAITEALAGLDDVKFHRKVDKAINRFNHRWLNGSEKGLAAIQRFFSYIVVRQFFGDIIVPITSKPVLGQLLLGSSYRTRCSTGKSAQEIVTATRESLKQRDYSSRSAKTLLDHATLAVRVHHKYNDDLQKTLEGEHRTLNNNLSRDIGPFYDAIGYTLKTGPKPHEGSSPITLPDRSKRPRIAPTFNHSWYEHKK